MAGHTGTMNLTLHVWRQNDSKTSGRFVKYNANDIPKAASFLEMLDIVNEELIEAGDDPIAFDHDCREGICGMCGIVINGVPHGPRPKTTTCQLHMFELAKDGVDEIYLEPWRAQGFPVLKDLMVDRSSFDRIVQAGGYITIRTGSAPDGNEIPIPKPLADRAMNAAECIGCGACVAACPNASASLFTAAKLGHLALLPQGHAEQPQRTQKMVSQMDAEGFGSCTNHGECEKACPKSISIDWIAQMNRDFVKAMVTARTEVAARQKK